MDRYNTNLKKGGIDRRREHGCHPRHNGVCHQDNGAKFYRHNYKET
jgi:hypothetical protein